VKPSERDEGVAIVTGGGGGLGAAIAISLSRQHGTVVVAGRTSASLEETAVAVRAEGGTALTITCDVADAEDVDRLVAQCTDQCGAPTVLVNCAGFQPRLKMLHEMERADLEESLAVNLWGAVNAMKSCIPHMLGAGAGRIVNVGSIAGIVGIKHQLSYSVAKGALLQLTRTTALDYADKNITVNCVCPGGIQTSMRGNLTTEEEILLSKGSSGTPMGRRAAPEEIAELIAYMVGPFGGFVTGSIVTIDGGYTSR
jgi:NAD(P)-dependent dehydrogenase (short-subunit alcohol dehydrogenase family)